MPVFLWCVSDMWWLVAALAANEISYGPNSAVPVIDSDASVAAGAIPLRSGFDLGATGADDEHRLRVLDHVVAPEETRNPFIVSALEDDRQRLTFGVKPGLRRARIGVNYSLSLD